MAISCQTSFELLFVVRIVTYFLSHRTHAHILGNLISYYPSVNCCFVIIPCITAGTPINHCHVYVILRAIRREVCIRDIATTNYLPTRGTPSPYP